MLKLSVDKVWEKKSSIVLASSYLLLVILEYGLGVGGWGRAIQSLGKYSVILHLPQTILEKGGLRGIEVLYGVISTQHERFIESCSQFQSHLLGVVLNNYCLTDWLSDLTD